MILLYLSQNIIFTAGMPIPSSSRNPVAHYESTPAVLDASSLPVFGDDRSLFDLIWSCLTTIIACSWVSVHPNMPGSNESYVRTHLRHLGYLFWAVIAPEAVIYWAAKQWFGARKLAKDFSDHGWTVTHGHFLQMGGFILYENGEEKQVVNPELLRKLVDEHRVKFPKVRKKDIEDRSKASDFGKALVVVQTSWFVVQCIARRVNNLPITKLELATVALALLNGAMYVCWWHKPFDAQTKIPIHLLPGPQPSASDLSNLRVEVSQKELPRNDTLESKRASGVRSCDCNFSRLAYNIFWHWPRVTLMSIYHNVSAMSTRCAPPIYVDRVSSFYSLPIDKTTDLLISSAVSIMGMIFAAVHCAGWNFGFPTHQELIFWRICSVIIFGVAFLNLICSILVFFAEDVKPKEAGMVHYVQVTIVIIPALFGMVLLIAFIPVYILARLGLLVEACISLRQLPPGTLDVVNWLNIIPHV